MRKIGLCLCATIAFLTALSTPLLVYAPPPSPPVIGTPVFTPSSPSGTTPVMIQVNVTAAHSSVYNVTVVYTTDNWQTVNATIPATYNATTTTATAQIPALAAGGHVSFYIVAYNSAGQRSVNNNSGSYYGYTVPTPPVTNTSTWIAYGILTAVLAVVVIYAVKAFGKRPSPTSTTHYSNQ